MKTFAASTNRIAFVPCKESKEQHIGLAGISQRASKMIAQVSVDGVREGQCLLRVDLT